MLTGNAGNDTFVFNVGQANGDTVVDFIGNGAAAGNSLRFVGFGTPRKAPHSPRSTRRNWQINSTAAPRTRSITFSNGAAIDPSDFLFA